MMLLNALAVLAALALDQLLGEPRRWHPLIVFGNLVMLTEAACNSTTANRLHGAACWLSLVAPPVLLTGWLESSLPELLRWLFGVGMLYLAIGAKSLAQHAQAVAEPLAANALAQARIKVSHLVSRDAMRLDTDGIARATVESVLENGNDAVFGAIFWFVLLGPTGGVLFRLANTLDAMWGYRTGRFLRFGWAAARMDDLLGYGPARLTALTYCMLGNVRRGLACWRKQAPHWYSPNAGPVMAAGGGALQLVLGGEAPYHGVMKQRPVLGEGATPTAADIGRAVRLVRNGAWWWATLLILGGLAFA